MQTSVKEQAHPHGAQGPAIELRGVDVRYEQHLALDSVSVVIESGLRVAVVGPNGAGKSTFFNLVSGLLAPTRGEVRVHGHAPGQHLCLAYVTQANQLDLNFPVSVWDVAMMGRTGQLGLLRRPGARDRELVRSSLERVGLLPLAERQVGELSGGQRQRLFIARALAQEADLLLLDEPFAGLDLPSQDKILEILDDVRAHGVTVLFATHDLELAAQKFDRILLLNHRCVAYGTPVEVLTQPHLSAAYGGHMQLLNTAEGRLLVGDSGGHHHHDAEGQHG
ncbi:MAG: metal ABC transporter ATP-binding protein [Anaerolineales bacterium]|nr:MAG: metal ABC transporter ATP-binding protein [Anaerolineales bacterium]